MSESYKKGSRGFVVRWIQEKLGLSAVDGAFGGKTKSAIIDFQTKNGLAGTGEFGRAEFAAIGLPYPSDFERVLNLVAEYEGTGFNKAEGPHETGDDAGITFGIIGFTSNNGELQPMLLDVIKNHPSLVESGIVIMNGHWDELVSCLESDNAHALANAFLTSSGSVRPDLKTLLFAWGNTPEVQKIELERARGVYWARAEKCWQKMYPFDPSIRAKGLVYDTCVQNGLPDRVVSWVVAQGLTDEHSINVALLDGTLNRISSRWHADVISRKNTYINGCGEVHGEYFDLDNYAL